MQREADEFEFWFRAYLRRHRLTYEDFDDKYGIDVYSVKGMAEGTLSPTSKVQEITGIKLFEVRKDYIKFEYSNWVELPKEFEVEE